LATGNVSAAEPHQSLKSLNRHIFP